MVVGVLRGLVDEGGAQGVVLGSPPGPERDLLETWLRDLGMPLLVPEEAAVNALARELERATPGLTRAGALAEACLAWARTRTGAWVVTGAETRTALLLDGRPPVSVHALGDLYATEVEALAGACTVPRTLASWNREVLGDVDAALGRWLEDRRPLAQALDGLDPDLQTLLRRRLTGPLAFGRPAVVPKLRSWTAGTDPPR